MAHDLRSPIAAINGFAEVLKKVLPEEKAAYAAKILRAAQHLGDMADTLSRLARLESGRMSFDLEATETRKLLRQTAESLEGRAEEAEMNLQMSVPDCPVYAQANAGALRRVVDNLVTNAIKYGAAGDRVTLRLHTLAEPEHNTPLHANGTSAQRDDASNGEWVCLEVADTGPGIHEDFLDVMFEPFTQESEEATGSGLGLAVTKELVEAMGGKVDVASERNQGTTFSVFLRSASPDAAS